MAVEGENLGVATIYVTVDTTNMDAGITKSKLTLAGLGAEAQKQYDAMSVGQQKIAINLARQIELMGKSTAQQKAYYAQQKIGGALGADLAKQALAQEQALTAAREEEATSAQKIIAAEAEARVAQQARYDAAMAQERALAAAYEAEAVARRAATAPVDTALTPVAAGSSAARVGDPLVVQQIADYAALDAIMGKKAATTSEVAAAEAALDRLQAQGMISNEELADSFAALDVVTAAETKSLQANSVAQAENAVATKINSRTQYELGIGVGELASGNINRLKRTGAALANALGLLRFIMTPVGAGLTALVAGAGAVAVGMEKGVGEINAYNEALAKTGDISGLSSQQLSAMSASVAKVTGDSQHAIAAVMTQVVATGKFDANATQNVAQFATAVEGLGGKAQQAISLMASFGDDPVKAAAKLNDSYHLLSAAVVDQIAALTEQGNTEAATALAERAAAQAATDRVNKLKGSLIGLPALAHEVGDAFKSMWDKVMDSGRQGLPTDPLARQLALDKASLTTLQQQLAAWQKAANSGDASIAGNAKLWLRDNATNLKNQIATLQGVVNGEQAKNDLPGVLQKLADETSRVNEAYQSSLPKQQQIAIQIQAATTAHMDMLAKLKALGASQDAINQEDKNYLRQLQMFENQQKSGRASKSAHSPKDNSDKLRQMAIDDINKQAAAEDKETEAQQRSAQEIKVFTDNLQAQLRTRQETLNLQVAAVGMGDKEVQQQQELLTITQQYEQKQEQLDRQHADKSRGMTDDQYAQESAALKAHYQNDLSLTTQHYADIDAAQANWANGAEKAIANFHDQAADVAGQTAAVFNTAFSDMTDALMTFVTTGKLSFKSLVTDVLKGIAEMELKAAESKLFSLVGNMIASYFGGGVSAGGGIDTGGSGTVAFGSSAVGSANGNVFAGPGIAAYENQIVSRPTFFARGGNVMGEAGPEAIIPLSRDSGGRLGIKSAGGGNTININTQVTVDQNGARSKTSSDSSDAAARQLGAMMEAKAKEVVGRAIQPGGILWRHGVGQAA